jgi:uncharacterized cupin superfamily protein
VVRRATVRQGEHGLVAEGEGWYVLNAKDATWFQRETFGRTCFVEAEPMREVFTDLGVRIVVLRPGEPNGRYHRESVQEDFLVVSGECLLLIEEEEHRLRAWDFVHCPPDTDHIFVGAGEGPCVLVTMSARRPDSSVVYPVSEVARRHAAGVETETDEPEVAYALFPRHEGPYREGDLPG